MGYESRVYIGLLHDKSTRKVKAWCEKLATFELCKMERDFPKLFDKEINFNLFGDDGDTLIVEDRYGDICHYTNLNKVLKWLKESVKNDIEKGEVPYRRSVTLLDFLKGLKKNRKSWESKYTDNDGKKHSIKIVIVHYGY